MTFPSPGRVHRRSRATRHLVVDGDAVAVSIRPSISPGHVPVAL